MCCDYGCVSFGGVVNGAVGRGIAFWSDSEHSSLRSAYYILIPAFIFRVKGFSPAAARKLNAPFPFPLRGKPGRAGSPHAEARCVPVNITGTHRCFWLPPQEGSAPLWIPRAFKSATAAIKLSIIHAGTALASSTEAAARHGCCDFSIAFSMTSNFLMHATRATFGAFPPAVRCL